MKSTHLIKAAVTAATCAFALAAALGCSSGGAAPSGGSEGTSPGPSAASAAPAPETSPETAASAEAQTSMLPAAESQQTESAPIDASQVTEENAAELGYQVFEGTMHVCSAEDLIELQAIDIDPAAAGGGGTYAVLVFDQPTDVVGQSADGSGERTESSEMLGVAEFTEYESFVVEYGDLEACKALDGQHVKLAAQTESIMFPSDVRLPIGQPSAKVTVIL